MTDQPAGTCPAWCVLGMIYPCVLEAGHVGSHISTGIHLEWSDNDD